MATVLKAQIKDVKEAARPLNRLVQFFAKYPPPRYSAVATGQILPTFKQRQQIDAKPLSATNLPQAVSMPSAATPLAQELPEADQAIAAVAVESQLQTIVEEMYETESANTTPSGKSTSKRFPPNPFLPYKNPATGRWRGARIGLRQQADLFKYARAYGVERLLPPSIKSTVYKQQRALERGLAVKGTGQGQQVKGHKWERQMASTLEKRRKAMEGMPELIREWEQRGHGRGWKKYPR